MAKCTFCAEVIPQGTGFLYVKKDGRVLAFCSGKCKKNMLKLKRKAINVRWTAASRMG
ncbi:TPA: 50S ribosomal protein L24e [Candidatus Woesearchaeota archaeon]|nr:50S ribosomal protein L24e [Candidatus Woesearchaeota archaeon]